MASPFFRLPVEIRESIYQLVLISPKAIVLRPQNRQQRRRSTLRSGRALRPTEEQDDSKVLEGRSMLTILFTCRQIYNEAVPTYYRLNTFYTADVRVLREFVDTIGDACRKEVASMDLSDCLSRLAPKIVLQLTGLRNLVFNLYAFPDGDFLLEFCDSMKSLEFLDLGRLFYNRNTKKIAEHTLSHGVEPRRLVVKLTVVNHRAQWETQFLTLCFAPSYALVGHSP